VTWENPPAWRRQQILRDTRTVAVVGASPNPARASNFVATYLLASTGFEVYFVNPNATTILGRPVYPSLAELPVCRTWSTCSAVPRTSTGCSTRCLPSTRRPSTFWLQFGLFDEELARRAESAAAGPSSWTAASRSSTRASHGGLHIAGFDTGVISSRRRD
jgi:predicted CoA-binding protein